MTFMDFLQWSEPYYWIGMWTYVLISAIECLIHRTIRQVIDLDINIFLAIGEVILSMAVCVLIWPFILGAWLHEKFKQYAGRRRDRVRIIGVPERAERRRQGRAEAKRRGIGPGGYA